MEWNQATITELEKDFERLKTLYEQYFVKIEPKEPAALKEEVSAKIKALSGATIKSTALKFRASNLIQRLVVYIGYWNRMLKMREEGISPKPLSKNRGDEKKPFGSFDTGNEPSQVKGAPEFKTLPEERINELFQQFIQMKKKNNEETSGINFRGFKQSILKAVPRIVERFQCQKVEFEVLVKDGKVLLKGKPME